MCNTEIVQRCVKRDGSLLTFIPRPSWTSPLSLARPMTLRPLGPLEAVNSTTGNQTNTAKDPSCQPIQRDKLFVGEKLWAGEHLELRRDGRLAICASNGTVTSVEFEGGLEEDDYIVYVTNEPMP